MQKFRRLSSMHERKNPQKMQTLSLEISKIDLNYKLQLLASKYQKEWTCKAWLKVTLLKNKLMQKFRRLSSMHERKNPQKMQTLSLEISKIDLNYKLQLLASEGVTRRCSGKNVFLKISKKLHRKKPVHARVSFFIKLHASGNFI